MAGPGPIWRRHKRPVDAGNCKMCGAPFTKFYRSQLHCSAKCRYDYSYLRGRAKIAAHILRLDGT